MSDLRLRKVQRMSNTSPAVPIILFNTYVNFSAPRMPLIIVICHALSYTSILVGTGPLTQQRWSIPAPNQAGRGGIRLRVLPSLKKSR